MHNELILLASGLADIIFVFIAARMGERWLYGTITMNLILISIFGSNLISVMGMVTNAGNIFYACVFLATHFLFQMNTGRDKHETIWFGAVTMLFFIIFSQFILHFNTYVSGSSASDALRSVFGLSPRIAAASIIAFMFAQHVNIHVYEWIDSVAFAHGLSRHTGRMLWLKVNGANAIAQIVDSSIFFTIAFLDLPANLLLPAILSGTIIKILLVAFGTPFLYIDRYLRRTM